MNSSIVAMLKKKSSLSPSEDTDCSSGGSMKRSKDYQITDSGNSNMKVIVRIRPESEIEIRGNCEAIIKPLDGHVIIFDPKEDNMPQFEKVDSLKRKRRPFLSKKHKDLRFAFDRVFDETSTQHEVFESSTKSIIDGLLDGINCSVFAYGATGAGKTHTMLGNEVEPGVMFLTTMEMYRRIEQLKFNKICEVAVTYLEIYNESIRDLLVPSGTLAIREDGNNELVVSGLSQHQPKSAEDLLRMLADGNKNRTQHPTDANATSSRSHAVFQIYVNQRPRSGGLSAEVTQGKMSLIDLAGSERGTVTTNKGPRMREGANINRSLLALGNCINALAANKGKSSHVPYRNSKLTRLLKDSLGGNCRTVMIANISPSGLSYEDTYNTLRYADRAKQIKTKLVRNVVNVDYHIARYKTIVLELQTEINELKYKVHSTPPGHNYLDSEEANRLQATIEVIYSERADLRKSMADLDATDRDTLLRIFRKEKDLQRIEVLTANDRKIAKIQSKLDHLHCRLRNVKEQKTSVHRQLSDNNERIGRIQSDISLSHTTRDSSNALSRHMELVTEARKLEAECSHQWKQTKHLLRYIKNQEKEISKTEKMFLIALELVRKQYQLLQATNCLTPVVKDLFDSLIHQIEGEKEVIWANDSELHDSLCNVSSLTTSHQALFDTIVSHNSPLRKGSRYSSPTSSASLGILTNCTSDTATSSALPPSVKIAKSPLYHPLSKRRVALATPPTLSLSDSDSLSHSGSSLAGKVLSMPITSPGKKKRIASPLHFPIHDQTERKRVPDSKMSKCNGIIHSTHKTIVHKNNTIVPKGHVNLAQLTRLSPAPPPPPPPTISRFEDDFVSSYPSTSISRQISPPSTLDVTLTNDKPHSYYLTSGGQKLPMPSTTPTKIMRYQSPFHYPPPPPPSVQSFSSPLVSKSNYVASPALNGFLTPPVEFVSDRGSHFSNPLYMSPSSVVQSYPAVSPGTRDRSPHKLNSTFVIGRQNSPQTGPGRLDLTSACPPTFKGSRPRKNKKSPVNVPVKPLANIQLADTTFTISSCGKTQPGYLTLTKSAAIKRLPTRPPAVAQKENQPSFTRSVSFKNTSKVQLGFGRIMNPRSQSTST